MTLIQKKNMTLGEKKKKKEGKPLITQITACITQLLLYNI